MKIVLSARTIKALRSTPAPVRQAFEKQLGHLVADLRHPSLRAKKYDEAKDIWQARVNRDWRFYFVIERDVYRIEDVIPHPK
jgi:plasmid maintenance system killer protein